MTARFAIPMAVACLLAGLAPAAKALETEGAGKGPDAPAPAPVSEPAPKPLGLTLEMGFSTNYVFRGLNVFGDEQLDPFCLFAPAVTYVVPGTSLTLGYWGGFQVNGAGLSRKLKSALGGEQDLWLNYDVALPHDLVLAIGETTYLYPMASGADPAKDPDAAGASFPVFLEPRLGLSWKGPVVLSVNVMYFLGLQDTPKVRGASYLYVTPKIGKVVPFLPVVALDVSLSYGFKAFLNGNAGASNVHDVMFRAGLPIRPVGKLVVTPGVGAAWTNLVGQGLAKEFAVYGFLNLGVEL